MTETLDKLFLELSLVSKAKTASEMALESRVAQLEDLLTSARCIAERKGEGTAWCRFSERLRQAGIGSVTPRTFRLLQGDEEAAEGELR